MKSRYNRETLLKIEKKWNKLSNNEKKLVVEFYLHLNPSQKKKLNESKWYNTFFDVVGIFDPTGIVDIINGISYWKQDDKLFAILSWISAIPLLGIMSSVLSKKIKKDNRFIKILSNCEAKLNHSTAII